MSVEGHRPRFRRSAHETILDHVYSSLGREVGGVLIGEYQKSPPETHVLAAIPALEATSEVASVTFTHDAWSSIHAALEEDHPGRQIVGWYHSHPGFGIFLSEHDLFIQRNFFSGVGQVAHVVDPRAGTEGVFGWRDGQIAPIFERRTTRPGAGGARRGGDPGAVPATGANAAGARGDVQAADGDAPDARGPDVASTTGGAGARGERGAGTLDGRSGGPDGRRPEPSSGAFATPVSEARPDAASVLGAARRTPVTMPGARGAGVVAVALVIGLLLGFVVVSAARADAPAVPPAERPAAPR